MEMGGEIVKGRISQLRCLDCLKRLWSDNDLTAANKTICCRFCKISAPKITASKTRVQASVTWVQCPAWVRQRAALPWGAWEGMHCPFSNAASWGALVGPGNKPTQRLRAPFTP